MSKRYIVEKEFDHNGLKCVVTFTNMGYRCGYVGIPKGHSLYGKNSKDYFINDGKKVMIEWYLRCHGGITYSGGGKKSTYPIESDLWWFGFDCAHYEDGNDWDLVIKTFPEYAAQAVMMKAIEKQYPTDMEVRSTEYVAENCMELADQLAQFS